MAARSIALAGRGPARPRRDYNRRHTRWVGRIAIASHQEIASFLAQVERRAYKQALFAVRDEDAALDIVQDAMLRLSEKYATKPLPELPMLFQRILQNAIHDHFRRQKVRSTWTTLLSALGQKEDKDEDFDPLETLPAKADSNWADPAEQHQQVETLALIEQALARLPARQRASISVALLGRTRCGGDRHGHGLLRGQCQDALLKGSPCIG